MQRAIIISLIALVTITGTVFISGCTMVSAPNNTTAAPVVSPAAQKADSHTALASGHVYFEGEIAAGASVKAVSLWDSNDSVSTCTDKNGSYILYLEPMTPYKITGSYSGLNHTIRPVYLHNLAEDDSCNYDISLTVEPKSTIAGYASPHHIQITATPADGDPAIATTNGYNKTYSLDLKPRITYVLSGEDYYGQIQFVFSFQGRNGYHRVYQFHPGNEADNNVTLSSDETVIIDVDGMMLH